MKKYLPHIILISVALALIGAMATTIFAVRYEQSLQAKAPLAGSLNSVGGITYYLYGSGIGSSDTSITLTSFRQPVNNYPLAMADFGTIGYLTLEPGNTSRQEFVSFTGVAQNGDGTATLTGVTRGLAPVYPYTASSTIQKQHAGGTSVVTSNPPQFYERFLNKYNTQTIYGVDTFSSTSPPRLDQPGAQAGCSPIATTSEFATVAYANCISTSGAPNASTAVKGIVQLATAGQQASSTALGATGAALVTSAANATDTPQAKCNTLGSAAGAGCSVIALLTGKISQAWLDLTQPFSFSDLRSASTTLTGPLMVNGAKTTWYSSNALGVLLNNGSGTLSVGNPLRYVYATTTASAFTTSGANIGFATSTLLSFPSGSITASSTINASASGTCADTGSTSGNCTLYVSDQAGHILGSLGVSSLGSSQSHTWWGQIVLTNNAAGASTISYFGSGAESVAGVVSSLGSTSINLSTATGLYLVLMEQANSSGGSATLNGGMIILNP